MRFIKILFLTAALLVTANSFAADNRMRIIASVGDEAITNVDLVNRIKIMIISSGLDASPEVIKRIEPQVLQNLINEKLQLGEAQKLGIDVKDAEVDKALGEVEARNKMAPGGLTNLMAQNQIPISALREQIRAEIAWAQIKGKRIRSRVVVSNDEIMDFLKAQNYTSYRREYFVNEIVLPVETTKDEDKVKELAQKLKTEIDAGKDFASIARQFSQSPTGANGGQVGWLSENQIPKEIIQSVITTPQGKVSDPIRSIEGYYLVKITDNRVSETNQGKNIITARQYIGPDVAKIAAIKDFSQACMAPSVFASQNKLEAKEFNDIRLRDMPEGIRNIVGGLEVGGVSKPAGDGKIFSVFVLCEKNIDVGTSFSDKELEQANEFLFRRKLELEARKHLRELRASTNIDIKTP